MSELDTFVEQEDAAGCQEVVAELSGLAEAVGDWPDEAAEWFGEAVQPTVERAEACTEAEFLGPAENEFPTSRAFDCLTMFSSELYSGRTMPPEQLEEAGCV